MPDAPVIALTGASGFVGRHVLQALLEKGCPVRLLARDPARLPAAAMNTGRVEIVSGDLETREALHALVRGTRAVIHLAGAIKAARKGDFHRINALGARNLAAVARTAGAARFVHVSSLAARHPELSAYAASKRASEEMVRDACAGKVNPVIVRPPAVYGPGDKATLGLFDQLSRRHAFLPGRADARLSLIHVRDVARALVQLALSDAACGETLEIDDGKQGGYSWPQMAQIAQAALGRPVRLHLLPRSLVAAAGVGADALSRLTGRAFMLSSGKARELYHPGWVAHSAAMREKTGWTARIGFAEGFVQTLQWYCDEGWLPASRRPEKTS